VGALAVNRKTLKEIKQIVENKAMKKMHLYKIKRKGKEGKPEAKPEAL
jgi:hypothetical protein